MNKTCHLSILAVMLLSFSGCAENQTRIGEGATLGGILGAAAGGIIGHQSGEGVAGALIGGAVGAAAGGAAGAQIEKDPQAGARPGRPESSIRPVTMQQVVDWTGQGLSADEIINRISATDTSYSLTSEDVEYLQRLGVSQRVIDFMQTRK